MATVAASIGSLAAEMTLDTTAFTRNAKAAEAAIATMPGKLISVERATRGAGDATGRVGQEFELSARRARAFAAEGLGLVEDVVPGATHLLQEFAHGGGSAAMALQTLGVVGAGIGAAMAVWNLEIERMTKITEREGEYAKAATESIRKNIEMRREQTRAAEDAAIAMLKVQETAFGSGSVGGIGAGRESALISSRQAEREEMQKFLDRWRAVDREDTDLRMQYAQQEADIRAKYAAERTRIELETEEKIRAARQAAWERDVTMQQMVQDATASRAQAELAAEASVLGLRGQAIAALQVTTRARLAALDAANRQEQAGWRKMLDAKQIDAATYSSFLVEQDRRTEAQRTQIAAEGERQRREAGVAAERGLGIEGGIAAGFTDVQKLKADADTYRATIEDLVRAGVPLKDLYPVIARGQQAVDQGISDLTEKYREQPAVLDLLRTSMRSLEFGAFARDVEASVEAMRGIGSTTAQVLEGWGELPGRMADLDRSVVTVTGHVDDLARALANARLWALALDAAVASQPAGGALSPVVTTPLE